MNANYKDYGYLTTPGLSYLTYCNQVIYGHSNKFFFPDRDDYFSFLKRSFENFMKFYEQFFKKNASDKYQKIITVDCANGVAAKFVDEMRGVLGSHLELKFINVDFNKHELLNSKCGAEHMHKEKTLPSDYPEEPVQKNLSFDGDVDRIIY
jgi:phosphoacetylglucosamine mutase